MLFRSIAANLRFRHHSSHNCTTVQIQRLRPETSVVASVGTCITTSTAITHTLTPHSSSCLSDGKQEVPPASEQMGWRGRLRRKSAMTTMRWRRMRRRSTWTSALQRVWKTERCGRSEARRLGRRRDLLRDSRMAALMQEQLYEDGCADDD